MIQRYSERWHVFILLYLHLAQYFENFNVFRYIKEIMDGVEKLKLMINW